MKWVTVFCSASNKVDPRYTSAVDGLSAGLAQDGWSLLYGGGSVGLMGTAARAFHRAGGRVAGVIPDILMRREVAYREADSLVVTDNLYARKRILIEQAHAVLTLPGGFGTLDEVLEVITLKQLQMSTVPLYFLNIAGFFDPLFAYFDHLEQERCVPHHYRDYYQVYDQPNALRHALNKQLQTMG